MTEELQRCPHCGRWSVKFFSRRQIYQCTEGECGEIVAIEQLTPPPPSFDTTLDLTDVPFPVAYPLTHARDERLLASDRLHNIIFAAYQAMRVTGLLLLADYLACDTACRQLQSPIGNLRTPHWWDWSTLCTQLCQFWRGELADRPERDTHFPGLARGWREVNRAGRPPKSSPWFPLLQDLPGLQGPAQSANDALWKARNDHAHRQTTRTLDPGQDARWLPRLLPVVEAMVRTLFPAGAFTLWRRTGETGGSLQAFRLHGPHLALDDFAPETLPDAWAGAFEPTGLAALTPEASVPVYPLFVSLDPATAEHALGGGGLVEPVYLVDGITTQKVVVLGVSGYAELRDLAEPVQAALSRKHVDLRFDREQTQRWSLVAWAAVTARETVASLRYRKYFPEVYLERAGMDDVVNAVLEQPGRGLLLLGEAGSGKSSLLARLAERLTAAAERSPPPLKNRKKRSRKFRDDAVGRYLAERGAGDVVLFLSGRQAYGGDGNDSGRQLLCEAVMRQAGIRDGVFADLNDFAARLAETADQDLDTQRRVWLILDALNEADRFTDLVQALDHVLPALEKYPWLRLIVSLRSGAYHALAARHHELGLHGPAVFANARYWRSFQEQSSQREQPYLELRPFVLDEGRQAYERRQQNRPAHRANIPWSQLAPRLRELLLSPLYLHLFHETFKKQTRPPTDLDESQLLDAYLNRLGEDLSCITDRLAEIGRLMYAGRQPQLPVTVADEWVSEWRRQHGGTLRVVKLDPLEELVAASLLLRPAEEGLGAERRLAAYTFTHQRLCEQVLLRELLRQIQPRTLPTAEELLRWSQQAARTPEGAHPFAELGGALDGMVAHLAAAGQGETLAALLDLDDDAVRVRLLGTALRALGPLWGKTEAGEPQPGGALAALVRRASGAIERGERFNRAAQEAQRWLNQAGFGLTAASIARSRVTVLSALVAETPQAVDLQRDLAEALNELGNLIRTFSHFDEGSGYLKQALAILEQLVTNHPQRADLKRALGKALSDVGDLGGEERQSCRERALAIRRALAEAEPRRTDLQQELATALDNLGSFMSMAGHWDDSRILYEEASRIREKLVEIEQHRIDFKQDLAISFSILGDLTRKSGRSDEARRYRQETLKIRRALVEAEPWRSDLKLRLCYSLRALGNMARDNGRSQDAKQYYEEAFNITKLLVSTEPWRSDLQDDMAIIFNYLGHLERSCGQLDQAQKFYEKALTIRSDLVAAEPKRRLLKQELTISLNNIGNLTFDKGEWEKAQAYFEQSLEIRRGLVEAEPWRVGRKSSLSQLLIYLGSLTIKICQWEQAQHHFEEALAIRRALVEVEPQRVDRKKDMAESLNYLGDLERMTGRFDQARLYLEEALDLLRALIAAEPWRANFRRELSITLNHLGSLALDTGQREAARGYVNEAIALRSALADAEPWRADLQVELAEGYWNQYRLASDQLEQRQALEKMRAILQPLREQGLQHRDLNRWWEQATQAQAMLI